MAPRPRDAATLARAGTVTGSTPHLGNAGRARVHADERAAPASAAAVRPRLPGVRPRREPERHARQQRGDLPDAADRLRPRLRPVGRVQRREPVLGGAAPPGQLPQLAARNDEQPRGAGPVVLGLRYANQQGIDDRNYSISDAALKRKAQATYHGIQAGQLAELRDERGRRERRRDSTLSTRPSTGADMASRANQTTGSGDTNKPKKPKVKAPSKKPAANPARARTSGTGRGITRSARPTTRCTSRTR
jgi:hypothetical protein